MLTFTWSSNSVFYFAEVFIQNRKYHIGFVDQRAVVPCVFEVKCRYLVSSSTGLLQYL